MSGGESKEQQLETLKKIRASVLARGKPASVLVEHEGTTIEVRVPTLAARSRILREASKVTGQNEDGDDVEKTDIAELQVRAVAECCYLPGTDTRVFNNGDLAELREHYAGGAIEQLSKAAMKLFASKKKDIKASEKKSDATTTSTSSTSSP